jgi:hypothetical protein
VHLPFFIDAGQPVKQALNRPQQRMQKRTFTIEDVRHEKPDGLCERDYDRDVDQNL